MRARWHAHLQNAPVSLQNASLGLWMTRTAHLLNAPPIAARLRNLLACLRRGRAQRRTPGWADRAGLGCCVPKVNPNTRVTIRRTRYRHRGRCPREEGRCGIISGRAPWAAQNTIEVSQRRSRSRRPPGGRARSTDPWCQAVPFAWVSPSVGVAPPTLAHSNRGPETYRVDRKMECCVERRHEQAAARRKFQSKVERNT